MDTTRPRLGGPGGSRRQSSDTGDVLGTGRERRRTSGTPPTDEERGRRRRSSGQRSKSSERARSADRRRRPAPGSTVSWRLVYLVLVLVRFYFTLVPSYIHPDEHFQGPEVMAGEVFGWQTTRTWEFTAERPIRSIVPLWLAYGLPLTFLRWIYDLSSDVNPMLAYYFLRLFFFAASFSLEDWALQELGKTQAEKALYLLTVGSSYVTWTYQTHTFSNSVETILLLWTLALMKRITTRTFQHTRRSLSCYVLGVLVAVGVFNRITFAGFLILPGLSFARFLLRHPLSAVHIALGGAAMAALMVYADTRFYQTAPVVLTPWNNVAYNMQTANLALHGLHARYTHALINLPQLLGPYMAFVRPSRALPFLAAVSGTAVLSVFQHQEARFLLPAVPLFLMSVELPRSPGLRRALVAAVVVFNGAFALLMGVVHQGGVVPAQAGFMATHLAQTQDVVWWKTYSPPDWLLGNHRSAFVHHGGLDHPDELGPLFERATVRLLAGDAAAAAAPGAPTPAPDASRGPPASDYYSQTVRARGRARRAKRSLGDAPAVRLWDVMGSDLAVVDALLGLIVDQYANLTAAPDIDFDPAKRHLFVVAPISATGLGELLDNPARPYVLRREWLYRRHVNMDDFSFVLPAAAADRAALETWNPLANAWRKACLFWAQNRPGLGVYRVVLRERASV
ncbi:Alg9-like mannosyltransferase family-domain-containing protein [Dipodascopsis tothii]|uniref:Alg9-like mannosyltransferase family-domain-containing protein n=1 Tax=Dipodascopsis tothii TaxID=44089 RepID=UPI0034D000E5